MREDRTWRKQAFAALLCVLCALMAVRTGKKAKSAAQDISSNEEGK